MGENLEAALWDKCVEFHGHICPGLVLGFRAALIARQELGFDRSGDEEVVTIVENDACGVDAVQVLTGCTMGKGNLIFRDYGKQVYTFGKRNTGEAVRISVRNPIMERNPEQVNLRKKVFNGEASQKEIELFQKRNIENSYRLLELPAEDFCDIKKINIEFPEKASIYENVICAKCGEGAMETRIRLQDGNPFCLTCAD